MATSREPYHHVFGADWTEKKLRFVDEYLKGFVTVLKNKPFKTHYIDPFAGSGQRSELRENAFTGEVDEEMDEEYQEYDVYEGSASLALQVDPPFGHYLLNDNDPHKINALQGLVEEHGYTDRCEVSNKDYREFMLSACNHINSFEYNRGVLFLDPFAMQVEWDVIENVANTRKLDVWILFPIGALQRCLRNKGLEHIPVSTQTKLDHFFGDTTWRERFYERKDTYGVQQTLFGAPEQGTRKIEDCALAIMNYYRERLVSVFKGGVIDKPVFLTNSKNTPLFMLWFALANDSKPAKNLVNRLIKGILKAQDRRESGISS